MVLLPTKSPNDNDDDEHDNETQHQLNSTTIDSTYHNTTTTSTTNCQSVNDVETVGLLRNYNGQTISINFKQTKMHHNATTTITTLKSRQQCHDSGHLETSNCTTPSRYPQQLYTGRFSTPTNSTTAVADVSSNNSSSRHLNKMQLIAIILSFLLAFSIQSASARPNVDRNDDSTSNSQSVALTSENEVSQFNIPSPH